MEFRNWYIENDDQDHPAGPDPRIVENGIRNIVEKMANNHLNVAGLIILITGKHQAYQEERAKGTITGSLLAVDDARLKTYDASVPLVEDNPEYNYISKFIIDGDSAGSLVISHPPLLYDEQDKMLLDGMIVHELQHAIDWVKGESFDVRNPRMDMRGYLASIHEARAFRSQLKRLMTSFGNPQLVMSALSRKARMVSVPGLAGTYEQPSPFTWDSPILLEFAQRFLKEEFNYQENMVPAIGKALLAASSMMPGLLPQMQQVPELQKHVAVAQDPNNVANYILGQIQQLGKKFFLKKFVR